MADVIVGRFALIDLIAQGGSGSVWRAWDSKVQRLCAAKVLRQRDSADLMRFVREKGVTFDHPHLLAPYGWGAEDEHVVIAMPLVTGGTLEGIVRGRGPLAEPTTVVILDQLLDALATMHSQGWIHRDVKPANLMFDATPADASQRDAAQVDASQHDASDGAPRGGARPHMRLADFGIAVHSSDVRFTHVGMINGTPGYMAPELFSMADPAPSHDIYAAGVVALMALNGRLDLHDGAFSARELDRYLAPASPQLAAVLRRMLAADPAQRYQDARAVRADLPRVPPGYPLTFADSSPFVAAPTLPPLPPNAPGGVEATGSSAAAPSPLEQARQGRTPQGSPAAAPPMTTPAPGTPAPQGAPVAAAQRGPGPVASAPSTSAPATSAPTSSAAASASPAPMTHGSPSPAGPSSLRGYASPVLTSPSRPDEPRRPAGSSGSAAASTPSRRATLIAGGIGVVLALIVGGSIGGVLLANF